MTGSRWDGYSYRRHVKCGAGTASSQKKNGLLDEHLTKEIAPAPNPSVKQTGTEKLRVALLERNILGARMVSVQKR